MEPNSLTLEAIQQKKSCSQLDDLDSQDSPRSCPFSASWSCALKKRYFKGLQKEKTTKKSPI